MALKGEVMACHLTAEPCNNNVKQLNIINDLLIANQSSVRILSSNR